MISARRLIKMSKWQRVAALAKKRLTSIPAKEMEGSSGPSTPMDGKGHCVVYSVEGTRFEVPLAYLGTTVFVGLLRQSQEEFGFPSDDDRITLPCDAMEMKYMMWLLRRDASVEIERALLSSLVRPIIAATETMALCNPWEVASKLFLASEYSN
jgi:hypothetical protein